MTEYGLENGLKVLVAEDHKSPLAIFQIWYRVGSRDETTGRTGLSHVLEHMMFKGTPEHPSKELSKTVRRYGGSDNAGTSKDYTFYYQILPSDKIELSFRFESDRMRNIVLDPEETVSETRVVMEERRLRHEDDPQSFLYENVVATAFKVHPYRWPVIGWMSDLARIEREELVEHYQKNYCPDNAFIVVSGDVEPVKMLELARAYFSGMGPCPPRRSLVTPEPAQRGNKRIYIRKEAELPLMLAAYHTPSFPHEDSYALEVLATILSDGKSARLYRSLVYEKKLALGAHASYNGSYRDPFLFFFRATAAPGREITEVEQALYEEIEAIRSEPPSGFELQKAKNQLEASYLMEQDSLFFQAQVVGIFEMLGDWRLKDTYLEAIRKVTAEDVRRVAARYLRKDNRTVGILTPLEEAR